MIALCSAKEKVLLKNNRPLFGSGFKSNTNRNQQENEPSTLTTTSSAMPMWVRRRNWLPSSRCHSERLQSSMPSALYNMNGMQKIYASFRNAKALVHQVSLRRSSKLIELRSGLCLQTTTCMLHLEGRLLKNLKFRSS
ncbi:hypothetical protein Tco_0834878 [Tanacetum coccineum]